MKPSKILNGHAHSLRTQGTLFQALWHEYRRDPSEHVPTDDFLEIWVNA
jgi:hypothetical protein